MSKECDFNNIYVQQRKTTNFRGKYNKIVSDDIAMKQVTSFKLFCYELAFKYGEDCRTNLLVFEQGCGTLRIKLKIRN